MPKCPFAEWTAISGSSGAHRGGPFKIVHHTTEDSSAAGAMAAYRNKRADPHFTVDGERIWQHIDTDEGARALRNEIGGVETNRDGAIQIELVGFAHLPKNPLALANLARLCRWIEETHGVPRRWPAGLPRPAVNGRDPGGHNRDAAIWDNEGGHYGHCHVPENTHWDPAYTAAEVAFLMEARFDARGGLVSATLPPPAADAAWRAGAAPAQSTMPDHATDQPAPEADSEPLRAAARPVHRTFDARADTLDFRDQMYVPTLIEVPTTIPLEQYLQYAIPILDQRAEGACTGFGLATVANYLQVRRYAVSDRTQVSARMFYELARRYDEWPGEDYSGSSARGAMKGWQKHGVCSDEEWPYVSGETGTVSGWTADRMAAARARPLGAYFRVNHKDLIALHAAIAEVGVLYATSVVHQGWNEVESSGIVPYREGSIGAHAFAIVAYDAFGLWIQNSWGADWGRQGFARISYDDWLANGTDVWVARLGAPVQLNAPASYATAHARTSGQSAAYSYVDLRPHLVSVGNDGRLRPGGDYGTTAAELATIFREDIPAFFNRSTRPPRLLLYAHGGLVDEESAVQRVAEYRAALTEAGVYPLAFIWRSDYWTTIGNILKDAVRRRRPEGVLDRSKDFMLDRLDDALEPVARYLSGKAAWSEMKENAMLASASGGAADAVLEHVRKLRAAFPGLEVHVVGHSAGAIFHAPLLQRLCATGTVDDGPARGLAGLGMQVASCTLWAPACTLDLFRQTYLGALGAGRVERFALYCLDDATEQDDNCAGIYNKSLLYLVSNAFEKRKRIPVFKPDGEPLAGLHRALLADGDVAPVLQGPGCEVIVAPGAQSGARHHGDFDDDEATVASTLQRILGATAGDGIAPAGSLHFARSASSLRERRRSLDEKTAR